jgi:signal transduction histidine kinase/CheY-like chemotaxis protein
MQSGARAKDAVKPLLTTLMIVAAYSLGAAATSALNQAAGATVIWITSSVLGAGFLVLKGRWRVLCAGACWTLGSFVFSATAGPWGMLYNLNSLIEASLLAWLCTRVIPNLQMTTVGRLARVMLFAVIPATALGAISCAILGVLHHHEPFLGLFIRSISGKFLGMSVVIPTTLLLLSRQSANWRRPAWELACVFAAVAVLAIAPLMILKLPAIFLIFPTLIVIAFRYGPRVTAISALILNGLTVAFSVWEGPFVIFPHMPGGIVALPQFVATVFFTSLLTSMVVSHQERLRRQVENRNRIANRARRRAVLASKAKTDFLATMSHEIRTPMNAIIGFSQLLTRQDDLSQRAQGYAQMIEKSSGVLLTILDDILDFSKVEAGEIELSPRPASLRAVVEDVIAIVGESASSRGLTLTLTVDESLAGSHRVDDQRLRQILLNLANNAIKFTKTGGVEIAITAIALVKSDRVRFAVRDTGVGIAPERMDRLFKRFSQVDGSVTRNYGGTGLGLAICKGLVDLMGGMIGVDSKLGEGSTFWFELKLPRVEGVSAVEAEADAEALNAHILLVDDHPANRELGAAILALLGCTVELANDGAHAVDAAGLKRFDAILMDVHMPGIDGLTATRRIRSGDTPNALTPIIAMSADVLPEQVARCLEAGMVDSVGKPIRIETLHAVLSRWIGCNADGQARAA